MLDGIGSITDVFEKLYYNMLIISDIFADYWCAAVTVRSAVIIIFTTYITALVGCLVGRLDGWLPSGWLGLF